MGLPRLPGSQIFAHLLRLLLQAPNPFPASGSLIFVGAFGCPCSTCSHAVAPFQMPDLLLYVCLALDREIPNQYWVFVLFPRRTRDRPPWRSWAIDPPFHG